MTMKVPRRAWYAVLAVVLLVVLVLVVALLRERGDESGNGAVGADAASGPVVATVNGRPISLRRLEGTVAAQGESPLPAAEVLSALIDYEVVFDYGIERGLTPSDAEVRAAIEEARRTVDPAAVEAALKAAAEQGSAVDAAGYWESPFLVDAYRKTITVARARDWLEEIVRTGYSETTYEELVAGVRSQASIRILDERFKLP